MVLFRITRSDFIGFAVIRYGDDQQALFILHCMAMEAYTMYMIRLRF